MTDTILTQERLKELLHYNPETGIFTWKSKTHSKSPVIIGSELKNTDKDGYLRVSLFCKYYKLHRLAWFYVFGHWPKNQIDHINCNKKDNRINNLRDVSQSQNMQNIHTSNCNKESGLPRGIYFELGKYRARIKSNNVIKNLGSFDSLSDAVNAYRYEKELNVRKFVNNTGHVYTLDELRKRDADAFRKAGV